jgi:formylglycine-generating enzyme required for sulfatase activity
VGLFRAYADANGGKVPTSKWSGDEDQDFLPVLGATGPEAAKFAEWLGARGRGRLPTCEQWDQAAGKNDDRRKPFPGEYDPKDPAGPVVGGRSGAPRPVNRFTRDISARGCRDMSGNGLEWTRLLPGETPFDNVRMRAKSYQSERPFTFEDTDPNKVQEFPFNSQDDTIGFRVVIELE